MNQKEVKQNLFLKLTSIGISWGISGVVASFLGFSSLGLSFSAAPSSGQWYYPAEVLAAIKNPKPALTGSSTATSLRDQLFLVLNLPHVSRVNQKKPDLICQDPAQKMLPDCQSDADAIYRSLSYDYTQARIYLFNKVNARETAQDTLEIDDYYCEDPKEVDLSQVDGRSIPPGTGMNTEHVWPQSKFNKNSLGSVQGITAVGEMKTNLHILVPTTSTLNSMRSSFPFGEVERSHASGKNTKCQQGDLRFSEFGYRKEDNAIVFQPPEDRQGDIARIIFYFAIKYNTAMVDEIEEKTLREWHKNDPVDARERVRHEAIAQIQQGRNPFIDYPEIVDLIKNF